MLANKNPPLYTLVDLLNDPVKEKFYKEQLTKCPSPENSKNFFEVEKI